MKQVFKISVNDIAVFNQIIGYYDCEVVSKVQEYQDGPFVVTLSGFGTDLYEFKLGFEKAKVRSSWDRQSFSQKESDLIKYM